MTARRRAMAGASLAAALVLAGCSSGDGEASEPSATLCEPSSEMQPAEDLPDVAAITPAIDALRTELGLEPEFFEVNATARLVNLFVALNDATLAQAWLYADGTLTSQPPRAAQGGTFTAAEIDFDESTVFDVVREQLPNAVLETFYVHGNGLGGIQYGMLASTACVGGFDIIVGPDGNVVAVTPA